MKIKVNVVKTCTFHPHVGLRKKYQDLLFHFESVRLMGRLSGCRVCGAGWRGGGVQLDDCSAFDSLLLTVPTALSPIVEATL